MDTSLVFATDVWEPAMMDVARIADDNGFCRLWTTEGPGHDALIRSAELAQATKRIGVATGAAFAFSRHPITMAGAASDLRRLSGGRFVLGIGAATRGIRSRWFNDDTFDHPAPRLAEYCELVRQLLRAGADGCTFKGKYYSVSIPGFALAHDDSPVDGDVPIYSAGLNPIMLKTAAMHFDGISMHPLAGVPNYFRDVSGPAIAAGQANRNAAEPSRLAAWQLVSISNDGNAAIATARRMLAFYFTTPSYATVAEVSGWGDAIARLRKTFVATGPRWDELGSLIPEDMLNVMCPAGTPADVISQLVERRRFFATRGADEIVLEPATIGLPPDAVIASYRLAAKHLANH